MKEGVVFGVKSAARVGGGLPMSGASILMLSAPLKHIVLAILLSYYSA